MMKELRKSAGYSRRKERSKGSKTITKKKKNGEKNEIKGRSEAGMRVQTEPRSKESRRKTGEGAQDEMKGRRTLKRSRKAERKEVIK